MYYSIKIVLGKEPFKHCPVAHIARYRSERATCDALHSHQRFWRAVREVIKHDNICASLKQRKNRMRANVTRPPVTRIVMRLPRGIENYLAPLPVTIVFNVLKTISTSSHSEKCLM